MAAKDPKSPKYCLTVGSNTLVFPFNLPGCSLACHPFTSSVFILPALALFPYVYIDFYLVFLLFSVSPSVCLFICIFVCVCVCVCILWVAQLTVNNPLLFGVCGSACTTTHIFRLQTSQKCCLSWMLTTQDCRLSLWPLHIALLFLWAICSQVLIKFLFITYI